MLPSKKLSALVASATFLMSTSALAGVLYSQDFESGSATGITLSGLWHVSSNFPSTGTYDLAYTQGETQPSAIDDGNYDTGSANSGTAILPSIMLGTGSASLTFDGFDHNEFGDGPDFYDYLEVDISTNGGTSFTALATTQSETSAPVNIPFWTPTDTGYHPITIDLSSYSGQTVTLQFLFATIDSGDNAHPGARVDNIIVMGGPAAPMANPITGPGSTSDLGGTLLPDFEGGTLSIAATGTITQDFNVGNVAGNTIDATGNNGNFSGAFTGSGGLTFADSVGGGVTVLSNTGNTYSGITTVASGTLQAGANGAFSPNSAVVMANTAGATLNLAGFTETVAGLSGGGAAGGNVMLGSGALTINGGGLYAGAISGSGSVTESTGSLTLTGANSYTGGTTINSGATVQVGAGGTTGSITGNVTDNGALILNRSDSATFAGIVSGTGTLTQAGTGTTILTGANTYTGGTTISAGTLQIGAGGTAGSITGNVTDNGALIFNRSDSLTYAGIISGTGSVTQAGTGTTILTGANSYGGGTTISAGTLQVGSNTALGTGSATIASGATLQTGAAGFSLANAITLGGAATIDSQSTGFILTGTFSGAGSLAKIGGGLLTLNGNNSYSGGTALNAGSINVGTNTALGTGALMMADGTNLASGAAGLTLANTIVLNGAEQVHTSGYVFTLNGTVSGGGSLTKFAGGTLVLNGSNSYSGGTNLSFGTIAAGANTALGTGALAMADGTTLQSGAAGLALANAIGLTGSATIDTQANGFTLNGAVSGTGALTKIGSGSLILTGTSAYSGGTTISTGTLQIGNGGTSGAIAGNVIDNGTLAFNRSDVVTFAGTINGEVGKLQIGNGGTSGAIVGNVTDNAALIVNRSDSLTFAGVVSGTGSLTQAGAGTTILTGANSYTGGTTISSGTLQLGAGGTTGSITGAIVDNGTLAFNRSDTVTIASSISGTGGLLQMGTGTTILTGTNSFTGGSVVTAGMLQIGVNGTTGAVSGNISDSGMVMFNRSDVVTYSGNITGTGALAQTGSGTTILNGNNTVSGATTVTSGTLEVGDASHPNAILNSTLGGVTVSGGGTLQGHGTILGAVTNNGGTVSPGGSIGTLTVASYTQSASGTFLVEVSPAVASRLTVTGAASLNGAFKAVFDPGNYTTGMYTVLSAASVTGQFSSLSLAGNPSGLVYGLSYNAAHTQVDLVLEETASAGIYGDVISATIDSAQSFSGSVLQRSADCGPQTRTQAGTAQSCPHSVWLQGFGLSQTTSGNNPNGFHTTTGGFIGGVDMTLENGALIGLAGSYSNDHVRASGLSATASINNYDIALYAGTPLGQAARFDATAFYFGADSAVTRGNGSLGSAHSTPGATGGGFALQGSYSLFGGDVVPLAQLKFVNYSREGVTETATMGPLGFAVDEASTNSFRAEIGVKLQHSYTLGSAIVTPQFQFGVEQELAENARRTSALLPTIAGTNFAVGSVSSDRTSAVVKLGATTSVTPTFSLFVNLQGRFSDNQNQGSVAAGGRLSF